MNEKVRSPLFFYDALTFADPACTSPGRLQCFAKCVPKPGAMLTRSEEVRTFVHFCLYADAYKRRKEAHRGLVFGWVGMLDPMYGPIYGGTSHLFPACREVYC